MVIAHSRGDTMRGKVKLLGRVMDGTKVKGYWVQDETTGMAGYMSKDRVDDLGLKKLVSNCTAQ